MKIFGISHTRWERINLYPRPWMTRRKTALQSLWRSIPSIWFFLVEKIFRQDQMAKLQNNIQIAILTRFSGRDEKETLSPHHDIWGCHLRWWRYGPIYLCTWPQAQNAHRYSALSWIERILAGKPYVWQQDSEPCHTSRKILCWLWENFCDHLTIFTNPSVRAGYDTRSVFKRSLTGFLLLD